MKLEHGKHKREQTKATYDPRPLSLQCTADDEVMQLHDQLQSIGRPCGFLHIIGPAPLAPLTPALLLPIPRSAREKFLVNMRSMEHPLALPQIASLGVMFIDHITPSSEEAEDIAKTTRTQFVSKRWHEERYCRITSSKFGEICKSRTRTSLCTRILYKNSLPISSAALIWGRDHESQARLEYSRKLKEGWSVEECGLHLSTYKGYLGASPDGLVCFGGKICGCIEIKCPYSARDKLISDACLKPQFFCKNDGNNITLNYFYQIQGQLAILNLEWCDFVIWTRSDLHVQRVKADSDFWQQQCLPKLDSFYYNVMLPEIVYPRYPQDLIEYSIIQ